MKTQKIAMAGVLVALISVSAFIRIPMPYMPFTLQVLIVLLAPMILGPKISFAAIALYIVLGLMGLPVFASGGGPAYVLVPSFGFLIGFMLSAVPNGLISGNNTNFLRNLAAGGVGLAVIYIAGWLGFWANMNWVQGKAMSPATAGTLAIVPFIVPDILKLLAATAIARILKPRLTR